MAGCMAISLARTTDLHRTKYWKDWHTYLCLFVLIEICEDDPPCPSPYLSRRVFHIVLMLVFSPHRISGASENTGIHRLDANP